MRSISQEVRLATGPSGRGDRLDGRNLHLVRIARAEQPCWAVVFVLTAAAVASAIFLVAS